jgi:hypothetical protein
MALPKPNSGWWPLLTLQSDNEVASHPLLAQLRCDIALRIPSYFKPLGSTHQIIILVEVGS